MKKLIACIATFALALCIPMSVAFADTQSNGPAGGTQTNSQGTTYSQSGKGSKTAYNPNTYAIESSLAGQSVATSAADAAANHIHVVDKANILSADAETSLNATITRLIETYELDIVIYTNNSSHGYSRGVFAADFYEQNNYGIGDDINGMVMYICMESGNRGWYTAGTGACRSGITSDTVNYVDDAIEPYMKDLDFDTALSVYLDKWENVLANGGKVPKSFGQIVMMFLIPLVIAIIVGFINMKRKTSKMRTIRTAIEAATYMVADSFVLRRQSDDFVGMTVAVIPRIEIDNDDRSGFSGGFSSSGGGHSFSGGGRSF